jgi:SAM-dependent methyltransferase
MSAQAFLRAKRLLYPGTDIATRERLRRFAPLFRSGDVATLDVGCGNGAFSLAAYRRGNRVLGVDLNPDNVERCREYARFLKADERRLRFEVADAYAIEQSTGERFDQVIAFEILEHLLHDCAAVVGFGRVLERGGILHVSSPYLHRRTYAGEVLSDDEDGSHVRLGYTFAALDELFRSAGLEPALRGTAVGPSSRAALELVNRAERVAGRAGAIALLAATTPFRLLDRLPGRLDVGKALILYAQALKPYVSAAR